MRRLTTSCLWRWALLVGLLALPSDRPAVLWLARLDGTVEVGLVYEPAALPRSALVRDACDTVIEEEGNSRAWLPVADLRLRPGGETARRFVRPLLPDVLVQHLLPRDDRTAFSDDLPRRVTRCTVRLAQRLVRAGLRQDVHVTASPVGFRTVRRLDRHGWDLLDPGARDACRGCVDRVEALQAEGRLRVETRGAFAAPLDRRLRTRRAFTRADGRLGVTLANPEGLAGLAVAVPAAWVGPGLDLPSTVSGSLAPDGYHVITVRAETSSLALSLPLRTP